MQLMARIFPSPLLRKRSLSPAVYAAAALVLFGWLLNTPAGLLGKADAIGYAVCHRIDVRSFHLGERPVSLCARCTGMYLGALVGLAFLGVAAPRRGGRPPWRVLAILGGLAAAFALDGLNSFAHLLPGLPTLYEPHNTLRMLTGTGFGLVLATGLYYAFTQTVWRDWDARPVLDGFRSLGGLLALGGGVVLLVLTGNPLILYPLTILSAVGVVVILSLVYMLLWLIVLRRDNQFSAARQLVTPLVGGLALALLQIALLDLGRFLLTGTWEGFHVILG